MAESEGEETNVYASVDKNKPLKITQRCDGAETVPLRIPTIHFTAEVLAEHVEDGRRVIDNLRVISTSLCPWPPGECACDAQWVEV